MWLWILISFVFLLIVILFYYFNKFVLLSNRVENSLSQIEVQLKRRADLIPNLLKTVKGYAKHEKKVIKDVSDARKALVNAGNINSKVKANNQLEGALKSIFAIAENYPDLKANTNFLELQKELSNTEDRIAYARQHYNDSILTYNNLCKTMPGVLFARMFNKSSKEFIQIPEPEKKVPEIDF